MNASQCNLPAVNSAFPTSFASKADYLDFVRSWKHAYKFLSLTIRIARLESRANSRNQPAKAAYLAKGIAAAETRLAELGECPYVTDGIGKYHLSFGSAQATWMLELRAAAKVVAARQRAEAIAAGAAKIVS